MNRIKRNFVACHTDYIALIVCASVSLSNVIFPAEEKKKLRTEMGDFFSILGNQEMDGDYSTSWQIHIYRIFSMLSAFN